MILTKEVSGARWIERDGVRFEAVDVAEASPVVPEVRVHDAAWLPHEYGDQICQLFPRATAADALLENPESRDALERRGERLGRKQGTPEGASPIVPVP